MAEAFLRKYLSDKDYSEETWTVASAGCWAYAGMPPIQKAAQATRNLGAELIFHESQPVSEALLEDYNLILCMEDGHVDFIARHFPNAKQKTFLLTEMVDENDEIDDPIGRSQENYELTAVLILRLIENGFEKIKRLSSIS